MGLISTRNEMIGDNKLIFQSQSVSRINLSLLRLAMDGNHVVSLKGPFFSPNGLDPDALIASRT
jgi:hypothetical protein